MKKVLALLVVACLAGPASATYYVASDLNGWDPAGDEMTEGPPGKYSVTMEATGRHEWKVTDGQWPPDGNAWPDSNVRADWGDTKGSLTINFYPGPHADGWLPAENRVGYDDPGLHNWDIMGSFNGWAEPVATGFPACGDTYGFQFTVATPGEYWFKFRKEGDWDIAIGYDFSNWEHNIQLITTVEDEQVNLRLDLANGRYNLTPEPASLMLLGLGGLALLRRR